MTKLYYHPYSSDTHVQYTDISIIEKSAMHDLLYDLEEYYPPHKNTAQLSVNQCPAMSTFDKQSFILRSPLDISLTYNDGWTSSSPFAVQQLLKIEDVKSPIIQFGFHYLFWQDKQSDTQLFLYDPPLYALDTLPNFYITAGMIPIGEYTRNTSLGIIVKDLSKPVKIKRGQALATFTAVSSKKIQLVKAKPPQSVINTNLRHTQLKDFCPYTASKKLFSRWM